MADKRMFSKQIIDSDMFLEMPQSTQNLYFHLSMRADDDGFINNPKTIMRMVGCKDDDVKILLTKKFLISFASGVVVIKHWKIHNYIAKDRYKETNYKEEKAMLEIDENKSYTLATENPYTKCIQHVYEVSTQDRLGKDRLGKDRLGKDRLGKETEKEPPAPYQEIMKMFNELCPSYSTLRKMSEGRKRSVKARLKDYSLDDFKELFKLAEESDFLKGNNPRKWKATFDWFMNDNNMTKVLEGNYNNKKDQKKRVYEIVENEEGGVWAD